MNKPAPPHPVSGWLILDKPRGLGSTQGVAAVKRVLRQGGYAKTKVGHGGTLDPEAEGVLPIALGEATKLAGRMLDASKIYEFTVRFGEETDTLDAAGTVVATSNVRPTLAGLKAVLPRFTGAIEQVPPAYSALKVDGKRAYHRARAGEEVVLSTRAVTVFDLSLLPSANREELNCATLRAHVSKGTYIRSLARDVAHALGTVGHVTYLRRTKAGPFRQEQAISLDMLEKQAKRASLHNLILPLEAGLDDIPAFHLDPDSAQAVRQGRVLSDLPPVREGWANGLHLATLHSVPVALVEIDSGTLRVIRGFNLPDVAE